MTPSGVRLDGVSTIFSSVTAASLTRRPPPLIWRRASPLDATRPALTNSRQHAERPLPARRRDFHRRQAFRDRALLEGLPRGFGGGVGCVAAVQQRGRLRRQHLLGLVDLGALQRRELGDLGHRQGREQLEEADDVGVLGVAPVLPEIVRR